jgi:hypothetical protein
MSQETEIDPYYESGVAGVDHRNVDAAGEGHPFGDDPKEWQADLRHLIRQVADDLYDSWKATVREYLANAETACLKVQAYADGKPMPYDNVTVSDNYEPRITVTWDRSKQKLIIQDNGIGMAAAEVDQVFRHIGRSAARDLGTMSGSFGMGTLSFPKFIGTGNATMVMLSNSRLNDDNAAYLVSLAGVEPIMGQLGDNEYGTKFKLDQKKKDMDVRSAVRRYAEWMRVPVLYTELDEDGIEVFNEDWGDKRLYDQYDASVYGDYLIEPGCFEAYMCPDATDKTLLLSMDIERNSGLSSSATYPFDVRLLDESGKVVRSSNGNKGLIPVTRPDYNQMLLNARQDYITEDLLSNQDVTAQAGRSDGEKVYLVSNEMLHNNETPLPMANYVTDSSEVDEYGPKEVIAGPHKGRVVVDKSEWNELPSGRAEQFVPEDELEPYDLESDEGDLRLPEPTTDRSSLQSNDVFWEYIANYFTEEFDNSIEDYRTMLHESDDTMAAMQQMEPNTVAHMRGEL